MCKLRLLYALEPSNGKELEGQITSSCLVETTEKWLLESQYWRIHPRRRLRRSHRRYIPWFKRNYGRWVCEINLCFFGWEHGSPSPQAKVSLSWQLTSIWREKLVHERKLNVIAYQFAIMCPALIRAHGVCRPWLRIGRGAWPGSKPWKWPIVRGKQINWPIESQNPNIGKHFVPTKNTHIIHSVWFLALYLVVWLSGFIIIKFWSFIMFL